MGRAYIANAKTRVGYTLLTRLSAGVLGELFKMYKTYKLKKKATKKNPYKPNSTDYATFLTTLYMLGVREAVQSTFVSLIADATDAPYAELRYLVNTLLQLTNVIPFTSILSDIFFLILDRELEFRYVPERDTKRHAGFLFYI